MKERGDEREAAQVGSRGEKRERAQCQIDDPSGELIYIFMTDVF
jgi:hypothetical protein